MSQDHAKKKKPELSESAETVLCSKYMDDSMDFKSNNVENVRKVCPLIN